MQMPYKTIEFFSSMVMSFWNNSVALMIERLNLNAFKFFYYVAETGSVTLAAEKLYVTQGAVSKQILGLEQRLQLTLFNRSHKNCS